MKQLSESEQHNYDWLISVIQVNSGYTPEFKYYAILSKEKFERKMGII